MSHLIQDSIRDGSCTLYHDYRAGHLLDMSGNGHHGVGTNIVLGPNGLRPTRLTSGYVTVLDCTLFDSNKMGTIFVLVDNQQANGRAIIFIRDDSGESLAFYLSSPNENLRYYFSDSTGAIFSNLFNIPQTKSHCVVFEHNQLPLFYKNGTYFDDGHAVNTIGTLGNGDLTIGQTGVLYSNATIQAVLIFKEKLTATQIRDLHLELLK